ncbi:MAG: hypothetical protein EBZ49_10080 [Proteobacteria bacterium]|nr:hypothetical protein [Pseudomonadota bacterium]
MSFSFPKYVPLNKDIRVASFLVRKFYFTRFDAPPPSTQLTHSFHNLVFCVGFWGVSSFINSKNADFFE